VFLTGGQSIEAGSINLLVLCTFLKVFTSVPFICTFTIKNELNSGGVKL
jgi:hypothetical protein